ncbi:hypothetical protein BOX15_Mlig018310g1 [Macrostomum lignano]|uniref:Uncharacterized protein n=2 Tax=Macrostomum lignano TaxID=282301 RepID=A0A267EN64_9PLAT|nr:hypothetical protein BOX15_Mlig018310g1 [Macrostomum lignano]
MDPLSGRNVEVFKEPRGVIRIIQFLFAILAFATTAGYSSTLKFNYACKYNSNIKGSVSVQIAYPFHMESQSKVTPFCTDALTTLAPSGDYYPYGSYSSSAQFYVFVGVMAFLYTIGITVLYVFFDNVYRDNDRVPQIDFIVTAVWSILWFIASIAWSVSVSFLKLETYSSRLFHQITACLPDYRGTAECNNIEEFAYTGLNISLICGYANVFLWASSLWFLFKETSWFKSMHPEQAYGGDWYTGDNKNVVETGAGIP